MGQIYVLSSPSGGGKSTISKALLKGLDGLVYSVSHTTRPPRPGETDGVEYVFVQKGLFQRLIREGAFVEWAEVYGHLYGTTALSLKRGKEVGKDVLVDVDAQGAWQIRQRFPGCVLIYILPPSLQELEKRLRSRKSDSDAVIRGRLQQAAEEIRQCAWYDHIVINQDLDQAVLQTKAIVLSDRCKTERQWPFIANRFDLPSLPLQDPLKPAQGDRVFPQIRS